MHNVKARVTAHPFAQSVGPEALKVLIEGAREQTFEPNQVILRAQKPANSIYLIEEGKVGIEVHNATGADRPVQTIGPGSVLGWSWLFAPFAWHLQARALERTRALQLNGARVLAECESNHSVGYEIMKQVSRVVISRLQAARHQPIAADRHGPKC